jgi:hypothetical protein
LVKWAGLDKPATEVRWVDILDVTKQSQVEESHRRDPENHRYLNDKTRERNPTKASRWAYIRKTIKEAVRRMLESVPGAGARGRTEEERLLVVAKLADYAGRLEQCEMCHVPLTTDLIAHHHGHRAGPARRLFSNLSLDARIPRCAGGSYTEDNVAFVCVACNLCKLGFPHENGLKLIDALAKAEWTVNEGWLRPAEPCPRPVIDDDDRAFIRAWAKRIWKHSGRDKKGISMTIDDVAAMTTRVYAGEGLYQDSSGTFLPLKVVTPGRLDCSRGDSCTLGSTCSENDSPNDEATVLPYLRSLKETWSATEYEAKLANVALPSSCKFWFWKRNRTDSAVIEEGLQCDEKAALLSNGNDSDTEDEDEVWQGNECFENRWGSRVGLAGEDGRFVQRDDS